MEDSLWVVFEPGLHSKLALSKQGPQYDNFWLASGVEKVFSSQQRTCVVLGLLSRNVLMTVLSLACVTGSVIWVSPVDMTKGCNKHGISQGYGPHRPGEPWVHIALMSDMYFLYLSANQNNSWKMVQHHD